MPGVFAVGCDPLSCVDLIDRILNGDKRPSDSVSKQRVHDLDRTAARDLLLLSSSYDQSTSSTFIARWNDLRRVLGYRNFSSKLSLILAFVSAAFSIILVTLLYTRSWWADEDQQVADLPGKTWLLIPVITLIGASPWLWRIQVSACGFGDSPTEGRKTGNRILAEDSAAVSKQGTGKPAVATLRTYRRSI